MATRGSEDSIKKHGWVMTRDKSILWCKYCTMEVLDFNLLKYHLAGIGSDISACGRVKPACKKKWQDELEKSNTFIGQSSSGDQSVGPSNLKVENGGVTKKVEATDSNNAGVTIKEETAGSNMNVDLMDANINVEGMEANMNVDVMDDASSNFERCVATFLHESGADHSVIKLPSFLKMFNAAINCGRGLKVPTYDELTGPLLQRNMEEIRKRIVVMKQSWEQTGCTILLDSWIDQWDRNKVGFLVDCPKGTIFLSSVDVNHTIEGADIDALVSTISCIIEEVGALNVVQVISPSCSSFMEAARMIVVEKYKNIVWTMCFDSCIELILQKMESINHVKEVITEAKKITNFVYNNPVMRSHFMKRELVVSSTLKSIASFRTLENLVSMKRDLVNFFTSEAWSSRTEGENIYELIKSPFFWASVDIALKIATPFLHILKKINTADVSPMGFLYDAMDTAKEELKNNVGDEEAIFLPYWKIVDDIWDTYLHSHLHAFACYLNPRFLYSNGYNIDAEIMNGVDYCVERMTRDKHQRDLVIRQLECYRVRLGGFADPMAVDRRADVSPVIWWSLYGGRTPELQRIATRILSQTCSTSSSYKLRKGVSGKFLAPPRNASEKQLLDDIEFVRNNLRLMQPKSWTDIFDDDNVHSQDWISGDV